MGSFSGDELFQALVSPAGTENFLAHYWRQQSGIFRGSSRQLAGILSIAQFDELLQFCPMKPEQLGLIKNGEVEPGHQLRTADGGLDRGRLEQLYSAGETVVFQAFERCWGPLLSICRALEQILGSRVSSRVMLSSQASRPIDYRPAADLFVLQTHGAGHLQVHPPGEAAASLQSTLQPGEVIYIPEGWTYRSAPVAPTCLQVVFACEAFRWVDLLGCAVRDVARRDERFRRALPLGWAARAEGAAALAEQFAALVEVLVEQVQLKESAAMLVQEFVEGLAPLPDDRFSQLERLASLDAEAQIARRPGALCSVRWESEAVTISYPGGRFGGPLSIGPALEYIARQEKFTVSALPGLDLQSQLVLVRTLVRRGLLRCA